MVGQVPTPQKGAVRLVQGPSRGRIHKAATGVGIVADVTRHTRAHNHIAAHFCATVADLMRIRVAMGPADRVARAKVMRAVIVDQCGLAVQHVQKLVLGRVPMAVGRQGTRIKTFHIGPELRHPARIRQMLGGDAIFR